MRKMNRHERLRRHKRKMKQRFGLWFDGYVTNIKLVEDYNKSFCRFRETPPNDGFEYWKTFYMSGMRKFVKDCSEGVIRARYRDMLSSVDTDGMEDVHAPCGSEYRRMFDYDWNMW